MTNTLEPKTSPHPILEAVERLEDVAVLVDELAEGCETVDVALMVLGRIVDGIRTLQVVQSIIDKRVIELRGKERSDLPVPGGGIYKVSGGSPKKVYDNPALIGAVAQRMTSHVEAAAIVTESGEQVSAAAVIETIVRGVAEIAALDTASFSSWRSGKAREYGITLADYCETSYSDLRGRIEGRHAY